MRRTLLAALVAAVAALPSTAQAAPSPQVIDKKGDWVVASQDLVTARLSSVLVGGKPALRADLTFAEAPGQVPTTYQFGFTKGCLGYGFTYEAQATAKASFVRTECYTGAEGVAGTPKQTTFPATATISGTTLTMIAPYAGGIARGNKVKDFFAFVYDVPVGLVGNNSVLGYSEIYTGDMAFSSNSYVVGSDLPRK